MAKRVALGAALAGLLGSAVCQAQGQAQGQPPRNPGRPAEAPGTRVLVNANGLQMIERTEPAFTAPPAAAADGSPLRLERGRGGLQHWVRTDAPPSALAGANGATGAGDTALVANAQGLLRARRLEQGRLVDEPLLDRLDEPAPLPRGVRVVTVPRDAQGRPVLPEPLDLTVIYRVAPLAP